MTYGSEVTVETGIDDLWAFITDPDNNAKWLSNYRSFQPISGEQGLPGAKARHWYERHKRKIEFVEEILETKENKLLRSRFTHDVMNLIVTYKLQEQSARKSILKVEVEVEFTTLLFKLIGPFMKRAFVRRQRRDLEKLQSALQLVHA